MCVGVQNKNYSSANVQVIHAKRGPCHATEANGKHETNDNLEWIGAQDHDEHEETLWQKSRAAEELPDKCQRKLVLFVH